MYSSLTPNKDIFLIPVHVGLWKKGNKIWQQTLASSFSGAFLGPGWVLFSIISPCNFSDSLVEWNDLTLY